MIKIEELQEVRPTYRFEDGANIDLTAVEREIGKKAAEKQIPVAFERDKVKSGGLFNRKIEDCTVLYNPNHKKDYFRFCIRVQHQGAYAFVLVESMGVSKQLAKFERAEFAKQDRQGKDLSYQIGSMVG